MVGGKPGKRTTKSKWEVNNTLKCFCSSISENVSLKSANCLIWGTPQAALAIENLAANAGDVRDSVQSLGWEDPLEEGMATHSSIPAWIIPWTEEPGGPWSIESQRVGHD